MKLMIKIIWIASINAFVFGGITGKLTGKIKDENTGEPMIGCNIILDGTYLGASSNNEGEYTILNIPPNNYTCLLYTSPSPRDQRGYRMPSSA